MATQLIFEETTSTLYYSNDGRLHVVRQGYPELLWTVVVTDDPYRWLRPIIDADAEIVFASRDRVKVDAYIAGYDLATA